MVSKTIVICVTVAFTVVMAAFVFLTYRHIDTTSLITFVLGLATGVGPNIASYVKTHNLAKDVTVVKEQTNGPLTQGLAQIEELKQAVEEIKVHQNGGT